MIPDAFRADTGVLVPAVTAEEMAAVDRVAIDEFGLALVQLMEHAGRNLARAVRLTGDGPVSVLAGNGGNGGGGLVCARHLLNRGLEVEVLLDRPPGALTGVTADQCRILDAMRATTHVGPERLEGASGTVVDALIGYGLEGDVRGPTRALIEAANAADATVVSLDVPSGTDATTGVERGVSCRPDVTVTLALPKTGLVDVDGRLVLADIGIPGGVYDRLDIRYDVPFDASYLTTLSPR